MRIIKVFLDDPIIIEINKQVIEVYNFNDLNNLGLSKKTLKKLIESILRAQEKSLDSFTLKY